MSSLRLKSGHAVRGLQTSVSDCKTKVLPLTTCYFCQIEPHLALNKCAQHRPKVAFGVCEFCTCNPALAFQTSRLHVSDLYMKLFLPEYKAPYHLLNAGFLYS